MDPGFGFRRSKSSAEGREYNYGVEYKDVVPPQLSFPMWEGVPPNGVSFPEFSYFWVSKYVFCGVGPREYASAL